MQVYPDGQGYSYKDDDVERPLCETFWSSFLDGFTMAGLWERLRIPHTPTRRFKSDKKVWFDLDDILESLGRLDRDSLRRVRKAAEEAEAARYQHQPAK